jgi:hypothetical protein
MIRFQAILLLQNSITSELVEDNKCIRKEDLYIKAVFGDEMPISPYFT